MRHTESLRFICDPGLEDICAREIDHLNTLPAGSAKAGEPRTGMVFLEGNPCNIDLLYKLRTVYFVLEHLGSITASVELLQDQLCAWAETVDIPELKTVSSFRVNAVRSGIHPFSSNDINRSIGAVLFARTEAGVSLDNPELIIRIDIQDEKAYMSLQLNKEPMDKRWNWQFRPRVTLRTTIASAMIQNGFHYLQPAQESSSSSEHLTLIDPFCGSGTILLEAFASVKGAKIIGGDNDPEAVSGCMENAIAAECADSIDLRQWDALDLSSEFLPGSVDLIITNPPFGLRLGKKINFRNFYQQLLDSTASVIRPGGCMVLLTGKKRGLFNYILEESPQWCQVDARVIEIGGSYPGMFTLRRI
ncbi:THUMP domain-containing protein [Spirochaeta dissipatitropha]